MTNLATGSAERIYDVIYCIRGQAENLIKMHKSQFISDRTSCRSPLDNQVRLVLHTDAYWRMLAVREAVPKTHPLSCTEFAALRLRPLKLGAPVIETISRVRLAFAAACPGPDCSAGSPSPSLCNPPDHNARDQDAPSNPHPSASNAFHQFRFSRGEKDAPIPHDLPPRISRRTVFMNKTG